MGPRLSQAFETTNRYVLAFFNAYVKAATRRSWRSCGAIPEANGAPAGLATIRELPGIEPAVTPEGLFRLITARGVPAAWRSSMRTVPATHRRSCSGKIASTRWPIACCARRTLPRRLTIFRRIIEIYPASSNAYDSLSEALETTGAREEALAVTRKGLEVLERQDLTPDARQRMADMLRARLKRLS